MYIMTFQSWPIIKRYPCFSAGKLVIHNCSFSTKVICGFLLRKQWKNMLEWNIYKKDIFHHCKPVMPQINGRSFENTTTVQYCTVQYSTVQYSTVQYSTVQYSIVQYTAVQYTKVQYSTVRELFYCVIPQN